MPSKKRGRGRSSAEAEPVPEPLEAVAHSAGASSSSSSAAKASSGLGLPLPQPPASPSTSSSATAKKAPEVTQSAILSSKLAQQRVQEPVQLTAGERDVHQPCAASADAIISGDADADDFEDALEELTGADLGYEKPPEATLSPEEAAAVLLGKEPALQVPAAARSDWPTELQALEKLAEGSDAPEEEKLRLLHEALGQRVEDLQALEEHRAATDRCLEELGKERDRCRKEAQAALAAKLKLEDSCRKLQQLKIDIAQDSKKIVEDEQARQAELNDKFQAAMKDVEEKMSAESEIREHFIKENEELRTKLEKFTETYDEQERQLAEQCAARGREMEAARDRLQEYETKTAESKANAAVLEKQNKSLQKTTQSLRAELQSILGKFDEFHESVNGSNQKHGECKSEIDGLSANLQDLESENIELKNNVKANELTKEKECMQKQCDALEKLCGNLAREIATIREKKGGG